MSRRDERRLKRTTEKEQVKYTLSATEIKSITASGFQEGVKFGIERAVTACVNGFSLVLLENEGMTPEKVAQIRDATNREVFRMLTEDKTISLDDIERFVKNHGVE